MGTSLLFGVLVLPPAMAVFGRPVSGGAAAVTQKDLLNQFGACRRNRVQREPHQLRVEIRQQERALAGGVGFAVWPAISVGNEFQFAILGNALVCETRKSAELQLTAAWRRADYGI